MARQIRIEYPGALYHVMARGDRKEPVFIGDGDRHAFLKCVGEMCERSAMVVHAYVLMPNHYHLVLETPLGNLVEGMRWLQNTYTRRFNVFHNLWGHLFGGRYKALLIDEEGGYFSRVVDYVHLNPVRAGLIDEGERIECYPWSSLPAILGPPRKRPGWLAANRLFAEQRMEDTPSARQAYLAHIEQSVRRTGAAKAGIPDRESLPAFTLQSTIQRGWYFGSETFKNRMLGLIDKPHVNSNAIGNGYHGEQMNDRGQAYAATLVHRGCTFLGLDVESLRQKRPNDPDKLLLAELVAGMSTVRLDWLRETLGMGSRCYCSRLINQQRRALANNTNLRRARARLAGELDNIK